MWSDFLCLASERPAVDQPARLVFCVLQINTSLSSSVLK